MGVYHRLSDPPWRVMGSVLIADTPALGFGHQEDKIAFLKTSGAYWRTVKETRLCVKECKHSFA